MMTMHVTDRETERMREREREKQSMTYLRFTMFPILKFTTKNKT